MKTQRRQHGFTLIELIAVIVILGILAAVALPKFADMSTNARMAKMNGAAGSMKAAAAMAHSLYLAAGTSPTFVTMEGLKVNITNGYPAATDIAAAAGLSGTDFNLGTASGGKVAIGDATKTACAVSYTEAANTSSAATVDAATAVTTGNC